MKRRAGFTLIDLLVVVAMLALLAAMLFPVFIAARDALKCVIEVRSNPPMNAPANFGIL
jgi:prepilin-type N-terminal cleavage/methylation domain-containing protein